MKMHAPKRLYALLAPALLPGGALAPATASAQATSGRPNIVVIWGDDIGLWNLSAYSRGAMGYRTSNMDSIAKEGAIFTDHYRPAQRGGSLNEAEVLEQVLSGAGK